MKFNSLHKIYKIFIIVIINILALIALLYLSDYIVYIRNIEHYSKVHCWVPYQHIYNNPRGFYIDNQNIDYRKPYGTQYSNRPITIFGCSFAYGQYLEQNQIFSTKLSDLLKRPVYNRAYPGFGIQHMFYQVNDTRYFYDEVPISDTVIYILMSDHYYRALFKASYDTLDDNFYIHYEKKGEKLILDNYKNILLNFIKSSYTFHILNQNYTIKYIENEKNAKKITDLILLYFMKTRETLERNWRINKKDLNFIVFIYDYPNIDNPDNGDHCKLKYEELLRNKLEKNGFIVITTSELTNENLYNPKYRMDNDHPTEVAWDLITDKFIKKLNLK